MHEVIVEMSQGDIFRKYKINACNSPMLGQQPKPVASAHVVDRVRGMLLGLAIGDSLGNTSESMNPQKRRSYHGEIRDYLPNYHLDTDDTEQLRQGLPSDDTQLAFWTLEHLLENSNLVPEELADSFASGRIFGIGNTLKGFLRNYKKDTPWHLCGLDSAGNGALMRIAPVLIPHVLKPSPKLWEDTILCTMLTHNNPAAVSSSVAFVAMLWDLLSGYQDYPDPEWWLDRYVETARPIEHESEFESRGGAYQYVGSITDFVDLHVRKAWYLNKDTLEACDGWYSGAYLLETIPSVLYILMRHANDPEEAIIRAVNDTRDNDTIAAIVGAAVGALHGENALPSRWRDRLIGRTRRSDNGRVFQLLDEAERKFLI